MRVAVLRDRHARDVLHHEVRPAVGRGAGVDDARDVRVVHQRQRLALGLEARDDVARVHAELDDLERDGAANGLGLLGQIDDAHAAFAEQLTMRYGPMARQGWSSTGPGGPAGPGGPVGRRRALTGRRAGRTQARGLFGNRADGQVRRADRFALGARAKQTRRADLADARQAARRTSDNAECPQPWLCRGMKRCGLYVTGPGPASARHDAQQIPQLVLDVFRTFDGREDDLAQRLPEGPAKPMHRHAQRALGRVELPG